MAFRMLLIGAIVFIPEDAQLAFVFVVILVFLALSVVVMPYKAPRDNEFE